MKKLFNGLLALVMTLSMFAGINVNAATNNGTITLNGATDGKTYEVYKIFDLTYTGTGNNKKVSYTIDTDWNDFFNGTPGSTYITSTYTTGLSAISIGNATKYINITDTNMTQFAKDAQAYIEEKTADKTIVANGTTVEFTGLALGYYLVFPVSASGIKDEYNTMVSIDSTLPNATVNMKAIYPSIDKEVDDNNVEVGQIQTYTISGLVPDYTGCATYKYIVEDTMTTGLTFNNDVKVYIDGDLTTITATKTGNGFTVDIPVMDYTIGDEIKVVYTATVNKNAINVVSQNKAILKYGRDPQNLEESVPVIVDTTSTSIEVLKVDGNYTETVLSGAKFVLKNSAGKFYAAKDAQDKLITTTETANISDTDIDSLNEVVWVDSQENATVLTTDSNGKVNFAGIEKATGYKLVEIEAPDGYNRLVEPIDVEFTDETEEGEIIPAYVAAHEVVENYSGSTLPSTGSTGTKIFLAIGLTLAIGAYVVFITNKRMENYE